MDVVAGGGSTPINAAGALSNVAYQGKGPWPSRGSRWRPRTTSHCKTAPVLPRRRRLCSAMPVTSASPDSAPEKGRTLPPVNATRQLDRYTAVQFTGSNADEITQHFATGVYFWYEMQDGSLIYSDNPPDGLARSQTIGRVNVGDWVVSERYNANDWYDLANGQYGSRTFTVHHHRHRHIHPPRPTRPRAARTRRAPLRARLVRPTPPRPARREHPPPPRPDSGMVVVPCGDAEARSSPRVRKDTSGGFSVRSPSRVAGAGAAACRARRGSLGLQARRWSVTPCAGPPGHGAPARAWPPGSASWTAGQDGAVGALAPAWPCTPAVAGCRSSDLRWGPRRLSSRPLVLPVNDGVGDLGHRLREISELVLVGPV